MEEINEYLFKSRLNKLKKISKAPELLNISIPAAKKNKSLKKAGIIVEIDGSKYIDTSKLQK